MVGHHVWIMYTMSAQNTNRDTVQGVKPKQMSIRDHCTCIAPGLVPLKSRESFVQHIHRLPLKVQGTYEKQCPANTHTPLCLARICLQTKTIVPQQGVNMCMPIVGKTATSVNDRHARRAANDMTDPIA